MLNRLPPNIARRKNRNGTSGELSEMRLGAALCAIGMLAGGLWTVAPASAQEADEAAVPVAARPLTPEEAAALGNALTFDPAALAGDKPARPLRLPTLPDPDKFAAKRTDKPDGSSALALKQPLASEWAASVGADLNLAPAPADTYRPAKPLPVAGQNSGVAWASLGLPNLASLDARVDPANDQGKLGTTFKHSIPVGGGFAVTLQNTYSVTETLGAPDPAPSDVPLMTLPAATPPTPQVWDSNNAVKFDILSTGTSFGAGVSMASNDPLTHNTLSADQKLYGPLHVTTAVTDLGQPSANKSIRAGLKLNW
jgi:hypothetical protein